MGAAGLDFIIVGASISGLSSAITLKSAGHNVLILEKDPQLGGVVRRPSLFPTPPSVSLFRIPPNGTKILLDWGLEEVMKAHSAPIAGFAAYKYGEGRTPSPDLLGKNIWDAELSDAARGGYLQFSHAGLVRILYDYALTPIEVDGYTPRVSVVFGAEVVSIDCDGPSVTLRSGEVHEGHAIIGADGAKGFVRRLLLEEEEESPESDVPTGIAAYVAVVPNRLVTKNNLGDIFCGYPGCTVWFGENRGEGLFGENHDVSILLYTPDSSQDGSWIEGAEKKLTDVVGPCDKHVQKLVSLAGPATCVQLKQTYELESWISESGKLLAIGDAARPFSSGTGHPYVVALEDGLFIGKIFSHTRNASRVPELLRAFQQHRGPRCSRLRQMEKEYIFQMILPDGDYQAGRDAAMRERHAAGRNVLDGDFQQMMEDYEFMYGYEAADDADEWWMTWGRYHDSGDASHDSPNGLFNMAFSSFTREVTEKYGSPEAELDNDREFLRGEEDTSYS
ncbi:FAD-binding-3 domain-containing protein [Favolaschia claudopus]|uniref:FAD-binding-3 domain-containing protein n=1 Tax=Favolaschia claudopus TaxID=2862362 RepID=A0AAW0BV76_9AGAR